MKKLFRSVCLFVLLCLMFVANAHADRNIDTYNALEAGVLPCIGNPRVVVFCVTFPGGATSADGENCINLSTEEVESWFFNPALKEVTDASLAYSSQDSLRSFYYRSSYGKLDITGDVYEYTAQHHADYYTDHHLIWDEIIAYWKDQIDWSLFDTNHDGYLDGAYLLARTNPGWIKTNVNNYVAFHDAEIDGIKMNKVCFLRTEALRTFAHETFHMFGLHDIYHGSGLNPSGISTESIMGTNGFSLGDIPGICKYLLGWIDTPNFITGMGEHIVSLSPYSTDSEIVIVHPNGDPDNENWFIIEYVTKESNNILGDGIRIWRTCMSGLDEEHNIVDYNPYTYLEAFSPNGIFNYYYQAGAKITPTTSPSTAYGTEYQLVTPVAGHDKKYITKMAYSGISIYINSMDGNAAELLICIDDDADSINKEARLQLTDPPETGAFIDRTDGYHFATITAECELALHDDIFLIDAVTSKEIPVVTLLHENNKLVRLLIPAEYLSDIKLDTQYLLPLAGRVTAFTGADLDFTDFDGKLALENILVVLNERSDYYEFAASEASTIRTDFFLLDEQHVARVELNPYSGEVALIQINGEANKTTTTLLETGATVVNYSAIYAWKVDLDHFCVMYHVDSTCFSLTCYDLEGNKIDSLILKDQNFGYIGQHKGSYIARQPYGAKLDYTWVFEVVLENGKLQLIPMDFICHWLKTQKGFDSALHTLEKLDETTYSLIYSIWLDEGRAVSVMRLLSTKGKVTELDQGEYAYRIQKDGKSYVFKITESDLVLDIYDQSHRLEQQVTLLKNLPVKSSVYDYRVAFKDSRFIVSFDSSSSFLVRSPLASYLIVFDEAFNLLYYYHGEVNGQDCFTPYYLGDDTFLLCGEEQYRYVSFTECSDDDQHIQTKAFGKAPTLDKPGLTEGIVCGLCGKAIVAQRIIPPLSFSGLSGDADCSGVVDIYDALLVLQSTGGWEVTLCIENADANFDGIIDTSDVLEILLRVSGGNLAAILRVFQLLTQENDLEFIAILEQPVGQYVMDGQEAIFSVTVTAPSAQYQWYVSHDHGKGWNRINHAVSSSYTLTTAQISNNGDLYRCVIKGDNGAQIVSDAAALYVYPAIEIPVTGDDSELVLWILMMIISFAALLCLISSTKKTCRNEPF